MIGLGSNRLSVCRRGGMSVTQAGKGGMEWLAGGRVPSWVSPYSAQATAALKAQFPTQWLTIRDYGFSHPEIVGYMNAYAPEDAKIAYSLVPTLGVDRMLKSDGVAYIRTQIVLNSNNYRFHIRYKSATTNGGAGFVWGTRDTNQQKCLFLVENAGATGKLMFYYAVNKGSAADTGINYSANTLYDIEVSKTSMVINGVSTPQSLMAANDGISTNPICIYTINNGGTPYAGEYVLNNGISILQEYGGAFCFVPFKLGRARTAGECYPQVAQPVGTLGMMDVANGIFYPNAASSGAFSESIETPS